MLNNPTCPVCGSTNWKNIGSRIYRSTENDKASPYVRKRLDVLFKIWNQGTSDVTLTSVLCQHCGFVCYTPRPDKDDINHKYAFLADDDATQHEISQDLVSDERRSLDLYKRLRRHIQPSATILDFGGGNGRLMRAFLECGFNCNLIDFPGKKLPGVFHLGSQLGDIEEGRKFDVIICSHVLEHLAEPYGAVYALHSYLATEGVFYVEVPLEIWRKVPLPIEPVTHINYFTVDSLRILLERAGFDVITCEEGIYTTENGGPGLAIRAIARLARKETGDICYGRDVANTLRLLQPSPFHQLIRAIKYPSLTWRETQRTLYQYLSKAPFLWRLLPQRART